MRLYAEIGLGNPTFLSTEIESGASEFRVPGFLIGPLNRRLYARVWVGRCQLALDRDGFSVRRRDRHRLKVVLGVASSPRKEMT